MPIPPTLSAFFRYFLTFYRVFDEITALYISVRIKASAGGIYLLSEDFAAARWQWRRVKVADRGQIGRSGRRAGV